MQVWDSRQSYYDSVMEISAVFFQGNYGHLGKFKMCISFELSAEWQFLTKYQVFEFRLFLSHEMMSLVSRFKATETLQESITEV